MIIDKLFNGRSFLVKCTDWNWYCVSCNNGNQAEKLINKIKNKPRPLSETDLFITLRELNDIDGEDVKISGISIWK